MECLSPSNNPLLQYSPARLQFEATPENLRIALLITARFDYLTFASQTHFIALKR
jgi:hypothetical protein